MVSGSRPKGGAVEAGVPSVGSENVLGFGKYDYSVDKIFANCHKSRTFANLRDALLLKLISGDLQAKDAVTF